MKALVRQLTNGDAIRVKHFQVVAWQEAVQREHLGGVLLLGREIKAVAKKCATTNTAQKDDCQCSDYTEESDPEALERTLFAKPIPA